VGYKEIADPPANHCLEQRIYFRKDFLKVIFDGIEKILEPGELEIISAGILN